MQVIHYLGITITIRYFDEAKQAKRILFGNRVFVINNIICPNENKEFLTIYAKELELHNSEENEDGQNNGNNEDDGNNQNGENNNTQQNEGNSQNNNG